MSAPVGHGCCRCYMHGGSVLTCPDPSVLWRVHAMAAEQKQLADNQRLDEKIDDDVGELRQNASAALAAEKMDIRAQLTSALSVIWGVFDALNTSANSEPLVPVASSTIQRASTSGFSVTPEDRRVAAVSARRSLHGTVSVRSSSSAIVSGEPALLVIVHQCVRNRVEFSGEDFVEVVRRQVDSMVGDAVLLEVVCSNLLGTSTSAHLSLALLAGFGRLAVLFSLENSASQNP